jgi:hypothetical protein
LQHLALQQPGWANIQNRAPPAHSGSTFRRLAGADLTDI